MFLWKKDECLYINDDPIKLEWGMGSSKERKNAIRTWKRILSDLEKAPVYIKKWDNNFILYRDKNDNTYS